MIPATPGTGTRPAMKTDASPTAIDTTRLAAARDTARALLHAGGESHAALARGFEIATLTASLGADQDMVIGALLGPLLAGGALDFEQARRSFGEEPAAFARDLNSIGSFRVNDRWASDRRLSAGQAETLRKMLLAVITDPRLVLVRLAGQLQDLRDARALPEPDRQRIAMETREVYAPLANRLGIWQLKWELEDFAFRYLEPDEYRMVAAKLNERRADRERYLDALRQELGEMLAAAGIQAEVSSRSKHIYSIWRKMQRKELSFEQVLDVRAVRVLADSVTDCYAALGLVHGRWPYIAGEFDDYIATPKENGYRSLHTAVMGPGNVAVEIQIRTRAMHEQAELGVAAHWRYKEGRSRDAAYDRKIRWLRELLAPSVGGETDRDFIDQVRTELFEDRVYVLTPDGDVVDLPAGATPLDCAYHVHTELGHRCRGARINGRMVRLDHKLSNGEVVEIIAGKQPRPSRDWLVEQLGYLASPRSRAKVRAWFRRQDEGQNKQAGREIFEREISRLALQDQIRLPELIDQLGLANADAMYLALGAGDLSIAQLNGAMQRLLKAHEPVAAPPPEPRKARRKRAEGLMIEGIGDLLSTYARCCSPVPPQPIAGYVTLGRGVTIHLADCRSLERMRRLQPARVLSVEWGDAGEHGFSVDIIVQAYDRRGLVRDISGLVADEKLSIERMTTTTDASNNTADIDLVVSIKGLEQLSRLLTRLKSLPNVINARRKA